MQFFKTLKPSHLGLLSIHIWIYCTTHRSTPTEGISIMTVMYLALSVFLLVLIFASQKSLPTLFQKKFLDGGAAFFMAVSAFFLALPLSFSGAISTFLGSILGGIGVAWTYMRWGEFYAKLDIYYATPLIFLTMALGSLGKTFVDILPAPFATLALISVPFIAYLSLYRADQTKPSSPKPYRYYNDRTVGSLWRLVLGVAIFSFTVGIIQSMPHGTSDLPPYVSVFMLHGGEILLALALFFWVVVCKKGISFSRAWCLVLLLMATALLFMPHLQKVLGSNLFALIGIAQTFIIILLFLALADIARHSLYNPLIVFATGWVSYAFPFSLGDIFGSSLQAIEPHSSPLIAIIAWILVVVTLFFLDESSVGKHLIFTELNDGGEDDTPAKRMGALQQTLSEQEITDLLSLRCTALTKEFSLTPREHEILELLARGRSKAYIAEAFFISENTVRGHVKRLYAKLAVHSKQELLDLVESSNTSSSSI